MNTLENCMLRFTVSIRKSIASSNWLSALFLALCIPDICGAIETPSEEVGKRYKRWFNQHLGTKYASMFSADDCYYFRCSCLHQGLETHPCLAHERIHFITPPPRNNIVHLNNLNGVLQMQIDIFCKDIADATDSWYKSTENNSAMQIEIEKLIAIYKPESLASFISF